MADRSKARQLNSLSGRQSGLMNLPAFISASMIKSKTLIAMSFNLITLLTFPSIIKPFRVDVNAAKDLLEQETAARAIDTQLGKVYALYI